MDQAIWAHLSDAGRRRVQQLLSRALRNNDRPTLTVSGPVSVRASLRTPGDSLATLPLMGGERMTLAVVTEESGLRVNLALSFVPLDADLIRKKVRHIKMSMTDALGSLPELASHIERLVEQDDNTELQNAAAARKLAEEQAREAELASRKFRESEEWGEF